MAFLRLLGELDQFAHSRSCIALSCSDEVVPSMLFVTMIRARSTLLFVPVDHITGSIVPRLVYPAVPCGWGLSSGVKVVMIDVKLSSRQANARRSRPSFAIDNFRIQLRYNISKAKQPFITPISIVRWMRIVHPQSLPPSEVSWACNSSKFECKPPVQLISYCLSRSESGTLYGIVISGICFANTVTIIVVLASDV